LNKGSAIQHGFSLSLGLTGGTSLRWLDEAPLLIIKLNHIPKSFNGEATEDFPVTGAYRTSGMAGFVQHRSGKQFSMGEHTISSIGKIGAPLFSLCCDFGCGEEWLDFPTMRHYCQTHLSQFRKSIDQLTEN
jgi:hypothetical protein